ncbi:MAG: hypothetical protein GX340_04345 [Clostridiales bacterium]|jgi:type II secretory pathway component PulC|nr:hypothetical protein [Clostridiales bacterium]
MYTGRKSRSKTHKKTHSIRLYGKAGFFFVLILLVFFNFQGCNKSASVEEDTVSGNMNGEEVNGNEILPQLERPITESVDEQNEQKPLLDPFAGSLTLTGVLTSSFTKDNIAIIEYGNTSFIVRQDDNIADYWKVDTIKDTGVVLKHEDVELVLEFTSK